MSENSETVQILKEEQINRVIQDDRKEKRKHDQGERYFVAYFSFELVHHRRRHHEIWNFDIRGCFLSLFPSSLPLV